MAFLIRSLGLERLRNPDAPILHGSLQLVAFDRSLVHSRSVTLVRLSCQLKRELGTFDPAVLDLERLSGCVSHPRCRRNLNDCPCQRLTIAFQGERARVTARASVSVADFDLTDPFAVDAGSMGCGGHGRQHQNQSLQSSEISSSEERTDNCKSSRRNWSFTFL